MRFLCIDLRIGLPNTKYKTQITKYKMRLDIPGGMHRSEDRFAKHTQTTFAFMHLQFAFHWLHKLHCTLVAYCTRHTDSIAHIAHNAHISHCTPIAH